MKRQREHARTGKKEEKKNRESMQERRGGVSSYR